MDIPAIIPERYRATLAEVAARFGGDQDSLAPVPGGATGALALRFDTPSGARLVRLSDPEADRMRNPDQHACLAAAAAAGIAPALHVCEPEQGVLEMDFIPAQPPSTHPGGAIGVAADLGRLIRTL
ncbi:MAG: hypothetical protein ACKN9P_01875, partial [Phenylobacterium sp.]